MSSTGTLLPAPAHSPNLHKVFVYGTLLADEVVRILLKRIPQSSAAVLDGYRRLSIKERVYPAIVPFDTQRIYGKVLLDITDAELDILDTFEDVEYNRSTVEATLTDISEKLLVYAYVWCNENDPDLYGDWDFEEWKRVHLEKYLEMTNDFMKEVGLEEQLPKSEP